MRGQPWLRTLIVAVIFLLIGGPVWKLTHRITVVRTTSAVTSDQPIKVMLTLTFVHPPADFTLRLLNQIVTAGRGPQLVFNSTWTGLVPPEGVDFLLQAAWPDPTPSTAVRMQAVLPSGESIDKTFWAQRHLTEIVTLPPSAPNVLPHP